MLALSIDEAVVAVGIHGDNQLNHAFGNGQLVVGNGAHNAGELVGLGSSGESHTLTGKVHIDLIQMGQAIYLHNARRLNNRSGTGDGNAVDIAGAGSGDGAAVDTGIVSHQHTQLHTCHIAHRRRQSNVSKGLLQAVGGSCGAALDVRPGIGAGKLILQLEVRGTGLGRAQAGRECQILIAGGIQGQKPVAADAPALTADTFTAELIVGGAGKLQCRAGVVCPSGSRGRQTARRFRRVNPLGNRHGIRSQDRPGKDRHADSNCHDQ